MDIGLREDIQYSVIGEEIPQGDEGFYLTPLKKKIGYAEAALTEP